MNFIVFELKQVLIVTLDTFKTKHAGPVLES